MGEEKTASRTAVIDRRERKKDILTITTGQNQPLDIVITNMDVLMLSTLRQIWTGYRYKYRCVCMYRQTDRQIDR